jgi:hypothetical protein
VIYDCEGGCALKKEANFIIAIILALFFLTNNHLNHSLGDSIFNVFGISPWTGKRQSGYHLSVFLGLALLFVGVVGAVRFYRPKYPKILSRITIICIAFVFLYPMVTEKAMFIIMHNSTGLTSIDYSKRNSNCNIQSEGNKVKANCFFTIFNYGNENQIIIKPIIDNYFANINFETRKLSLSPHTKSNIGVEFNGIQSNGTGFNGSVKEIGIDININGIIERYE